MELKYEIAKLNISVNCNFEILKSGFGDLFEADFTNSDVDVMLSLGKITRRGRLFYSDDKTDAMVNDDEIIVITKDRQFSYDYISVTQQEKKYNCVLNEKSVEITRDMYFVWNYIGLPHIMLNNNRVILHGSFVIHNGKAIIFSGKSGIGKSTQAELWHNYAGAEIINGDKVVLFKEKGRLFASSLPIAGTSGICKNKTAEIRAIIFLDQNKENYTEELSNATKVGLLVSNTIHEPWRKNDIQKIIDLCTDFYNKTDIIKYNCCKDKNAVDYLKTVIG